MATATRDLKAFSVPVCLNGVTINPGDIIHADANGVLVIPNDIAEQVAGACEEFIGIEKKIMQYLERTDATIEGYLESEEVATKEFDDLAARLRRGMKKA